MTWCIIYLCCLIVAGYSVVAALARGRSRVEILGFSLCLGPGVVGLCLIFLSMLGEGPSRTEIFLLTAALAATLLFYLFRKQEPAPTRPWKPTTASKGWTFLCLLAIGYGLLSVGVEAFLYPIWEWDAFAIWQLKAKILATLPLRPQPMYFQNVSQSYSHVRYPVLLPMISAGVDAMTGVLGDLAKAPNFLFYAGLGMVIYAAIRRARGHVAAITATTLLMTIFPMSRYAGMGTAEMALTAFYGCSIVCLLRWQERQEWGDLVLVGLFSAFMAWTKNEGLALAAINAVVLLAMTPGTWRRALGAAAGMGAIAGLLYAPWAIYIRNLPRTDENYAARLNVHEILAHLGRLGQVLRGLGGEFINFGNWGAFWIIVVVLVIVRARDLRRRPVMTVCLLLVLHVLAYIPPYLVTNWKLGELLTVTSDRLLLHAVPPAALLIGLLWPATLGGQPLAPSTTLEIDR